MGKEFLSGVRDQLASRSTQTSLTELQGRGMKKVRVIRSSQILQLIQDAVDQAIDERGLVATEEERAELLESSKAIFQDLSKAQAQSQEDRARLDQSEQIIASLKGEVESRDLAVQQAESRAAELNAELQVLQKRAEAAAPDALLEELKALRSDIGGVKAARAVEAAEADGKASEMINDKLADLGKELGKELERIGRKVGIAPVDDGPADLSPIFNDNTELESNFENVEAKESKGTDVEEALARMKSLRQGK